MIPIDARSAPEALALNNAHAVELSRQDEGGFARLLTAAHRAVWAPDREGFLISFDQDADYASPNFLWFRRAWTRFVYVDRVVVKSEARGRGVARALYADLFAQARREGHERIGCEVNSDPPNPASTTFHTRLGFREIGRGEVDGKVVSYLELMLRAQDRPG